MGPVQGDLAYLQPVREQRQQGDRGVPPLDPDEIRLGETGGVAQRHLLERETKAWPETPADVPFHHQLAARVLFHLLRQLGFELVRVDQADQGGDGDQGGQRQPQQYVDDLLHDGSSMQILWLTIPPGG
ncbi:hypothetical protein D3C79_813050 [compost metagenome]